MFIETEGIADAAFPLPDQIDQNDRDFFIIKLSINRIWICFYLTINATLLCLQTTDG